MEANQIRKIYEAMTRNGFSELELEIGKNSELRIQLEDELLNPDINAHVEENSDEFQPEGTKIEIRSDKVGSFFFAERKLKAGDYIKKGEIIGNIKGISFQDKVKCSLDGVIDSVAVEDGSIVDYGRLLFVVNID